MGVFFGVRPPVVPPTPPACGSYSSVASAILDPFFVQDTYANTSDGQADSGEFVAIQYDDDGFSAGFNVYFDLINVSNPSAAMTIYSVSGNGTVRDTVVHPDGVIEYGDETIDIPFDGTPFFIVIENVGGSSCDIFELRLYQAV